MARHLSRNPRGFKLGRLLAALSVLALFAAADPVLDAVEHLHEMAHVNGWVDPTTSTTAVPTTTAAPTTTAPVSTTTATTAAPTTTTVATPTTTSPPSGERSYVNPANTGNKVAESQLTVVDGNLTITTDRNIENLLILGKLMVRNGAEVTAENITVRVDDDSYQQGIRVEGNGSRLTIAHFTVEHLASGWSQRGLSAGGGGWLHASFGDISGTEDGINISTAHVAERIVLDSLYVHDLKGSPPGGIDPAAGHFDGIQVMAGNVLVDRSVFEKIRPSTAAIFPKSDFGNVTLTVRDTFASGGGYTIYRGDECCGYQVVTVFDDVEANPYPICGGSNCGNVGSRWGAVRGVTGGATSTGSITVVDWQPGNPGFHAGGQS